MGAVLWLRRTGFRAAMQPDTPGSQDGRWAAKEKVGERVHRVGEIDGLVVVRIEEAHIAGIRDCGTTRELLWNPLKEMSQQADGVGDVEGTVLVTVSRNLTLGERGAAPPARASGAAPAERRGRGAAHRGSRS